MFELDIVIPVYNGAEELNCLLEKLLPAVRNVLFPVTVIVVDDGSGDNSSEVANKWSSHYDRFRLVRCRVNMGRAGACNAGIRAGHSPWVFILDVDCQPADSDFLQRFFDKLKSSTILYSGQLVATGDGFWAGYSQKVYEQRCESYKNRGSIEFTTACFACRRDAIESVGLFSEEYRKYGFEDRDLLFRLTELYDSDSFVIDFDNIFYHAAEKSTYNVLKKMFDAGSDSSAIFKKRFPEVYKASQYARVDYETASWMSKFPLFCLVLVVVPLSKWIIRFLEYRWLPFNIRYQIARGLQAAYYCKGTYSRMRTQRTNSLE